MYLYRICPTKYARDFSGRGSALYGGRWNSKGLPAIYAAQTVSLAMLEVLVHVRVIPDKPYSLIIFEAEGIASLDSSSALPDSLGLGSMARTRSLGDRFLTSSSAAVLEIPSIVHGLEFNYLINPLHDNFADVKVVRVDPFVFDPRLFE